MAVERLYIGCDMEAPYEGATADGAAWTGAAVAWDLLDADGATVIDSGTCAEGDAGDYLGVIESEVTAALTRGRTYWVRYTASGGGINDVQWVECVAARRVGA